MMDAGYNIEEFSCPIFSDSDETEQDSVTFDSVVEAELLNSSSDDVLYKMIYLLIMLTIVLLLIVQLLMLLRKQN